MMWLCYAPVCVRNADKRLVRVVTNSLHGRQYSLRSLYSLGYSRNSANYMEPGGLFIMITVAHNWSQSCLNFQYPFFEDPL